MQPGTPRDERDPNLSERLLDKEEDESEAEMLEEKAQTLDKRLTEADQEDNQRSDNQTNSERILDKKDSEEEDEN